MEKTLTREEMRELDRKAIEEYKIPGIILMENAGRNVAEEVLKMLDDPHQAKVAILCGKGNNGGDGFVVARHLHNHSIHVGISHCKGFRYFERRRRWHKFTNTPHYEDSSE